MKQSTWILPFIVISQFCCTSLWFAGNGVMADLTANFSLNSSALGHLTSAVQFGFISGTLVFALLSIADRYSPSRVFFLSALFGAIANVGLIWQSNTLPSLLLLRFFTGFFLSGIYPVGMKIAADYYDKGLGKSLGFLVGALVLGTAFPHLLKAVTTNFPWKSVLFGTSFLAMAGGTLIFMLVPDGPFRKPGQGINLSAFFSVFKNKGFRSAAFGYFGHMWELYAFWAFVPFMLESYAVNFKSSSLNVPVLSFLIIGIGGPACVIGGYVSENFGTKKTATIALLSSCFCCLVSPLIFQLNSQFTFLAFLFFWGIVVIADSPLFSTLVAKNAPSEIKGTALTIVNCLGFSITIISIQLLNGMRNILEYNVLYIFLAIGPLLGLIALSRKSTSNNAGYKKA
ncbi:MAG: MFS transporter [Cyclobacteriaceae bacterium]